MSETFAVPVYNPLGAHLPGYRTYRTWRSGERRRWFTPRTRRQTPTHRREELDAYRRVLAARGNAGPVDGGPGHLLEDQSPFARSARAFCDFIARRADLPPGMRDVGLVVPRVELFDARCLGDEPVAFITAGYFDVARMFANTVSLCARLNWLAAPIVLEMADETPEFMLLAWETMVAEPFVANTTARLLSAPIEGDPTPALSRALAEPVDWMPADARRGMVRSSLSVHLMQVAIQVVCDVASGRVRHRGVLAAATAPDFPPSDHDIDADYLALLIVGYVFLHEVGHLAMRHNALQPPDTPADAVMRGVSQRVMEAIAEDGDGTAVDYMGTVLSHEAAADQFALGVVEDDLRHPMLEAATLWCAILESRNGSGIDWWPQEAMASEGHAHPPFAMRAWLLNGWYSEGARQGRVAQEITRRAEALTQRGGASAVPTAALERTFPALWRLALRAAMG